MDQQPTLGFLVHDIARLIRRVFASRAEKHRMTQTDLRTIIYLARMEGCTQRELAEAIEITPITLGRQIDHLEGSGLIERRPHPQDRRATCLFLTTRSRPRLDKVREISTEISDLALRGLSPAERTELLRLLELVKQNLHERAVELPVAGESDGGGARRAG